MSELVQKGNGNKLSQGPEFSGGAQSSSLAPSRTVKELSKQFAKRWFPGGNEFDFPGIGLHDAAHQYSNVPPTPRGEFQQTIVDVAGTHLLREVSAAGGLVNDFQALARGRGLEEVVYNLIATANKLSERAQNEWRDPKSSPYSRLPVNGPGRFQIPRISSAERKELLRRGVEFYSQVAEQVQQADANGEVGPEKVYREAEGPVTGQTAYIHDNPGNITIRGGYDRQEALPFGPIEQFMEMPAELTVDEGRARHHWVALFKQRSEMERRFILSKSDDAFTEAGGTVPGTPAGMNREDYLAGLRKARDRARQVGVLAADEYEARVRDGVSRFGGLKNYPPMLLSEDRLLFTLDEHNRWVDKWVQEGYGKRGSARMWNFHLDFDGADLAGQRKKSVLDAIADARRFDARAFGQVREAIRAGTVRAATLAGAVPLLDQDTWRELGKGNLGGAAQRLATQAAAGIASSPVIGAVTGVAQRVAPAIVPRLLVGANVVGIATAPVAAVQAYDGFLQGSSGAGLREHWQRWQDKAAGMPSYEMRKEKREYSEGWITVPGKGRRWRDSDGNFSLQQPGAIRTTGQVIPQLFPSAVSVPANTPTGVATLEALRHPPSLLQRVQERLSLARERFNPAKGEWGLSELLFRR